MLMTSSSLNKYEVVPVPDTTVDPHPCAPPNSDLMC